jgi:hypothetical protein
MVLSPVGGKDAASDELPPNGDPAKNSPTCDIVNNQVNIYLLRKHPPESQV